MRHTYLQLNAIDVTEAALGLGTAGVIVSNIAAGAASYWWGLGAVAGICLFAAAVDQMRRDAERSIAWKIQDGHATTHRVMANAQAARSLALIEQLDPEYAAVLKKYLADNNATIVNI